MEKYSVEWWLHKLPKHIRISIINQSIKEHLGCERLTTTINSLSDAISFALEWRPSTEGYIYWENLYNILEDENPIIPLPEKWMMRCTPENIIVMNDWRKRVCGSYHDSTVNVGDYFTNYHTDSSNFIQNSNAPLYFTEHTVIEFDDHKKHFYLF